MWKRSELKAKAKVSFKRNYWRSVLISLLFALLVGGGTSVASSSSWREEADQTVDGEESSLEEDIEELVKDEEFKERIQSMDKKTLTIYMVGFFIGASIFFGDSISCHYGALYPVGRVCVQSGGNRLRPVLYPKSPGAGTGREYRLCV